MPTMQRRHYEAIARIIRDLEPPLTDSDQTGRAIRIRVATAFSRELRDTNPSFNVSRFMEACGVTD